jgi:hypothetical protein
MNIESIEFNTKESKLIVTLEDGSSKEYENRTSYIADHPDREADCDAIGWNKNVI